nr:hypothetical protein [uncultured Cetobacterium sp.]
MKKESPIANFFDTLINVVILVLFVCLAIRGVDDLTVTYKVEETIRNTKEIRIALEKYYQLTGTYPDLTKPGANMDLSILDYTDENGKLISFAEIYGRKSLVKTYGGKSIVASNVVYDVQNFEKSTDIGGWNYNYTDRTGEIHPNLPEEIYIEKVNWKRQ